MFTGPLAPDTLQTRNTALIYSCIYIIKIKIMSLVFVLLYRLHVCTAYYYYYYYYYFQTILVATSNQQRVDYTDYTSTLYTTVLHVILILEYYYCYFISLVTNVVIV
jgi:hypothetical protein